MSIIFYHSHDKLMAKCKITCSGSDKTYHTCHTMSKALWGQLTGRFLAKQCQRNKVRVGDLASTILFLGMHIPKELCW